MTIERSTRRPPACCAPPFSLRGALGHTQRRWARALGRLGMAARGLTFEVVGLLLLRAAFHEDPREARGVGGALRFLQGQQHGGVVLGLLAYGLYALVEARYRRVRPS